MSICNKIKSHLSFLCCGGMDLGLLGGFDYLGQNYPELDFEIVKAIDNDPYCTQIYNHNFSHIAKLWMFVVWRFPNYLISMFSSVASLVSHFPYPLRILLALAIKTNAVCCSLRWLKSSKKRNRAS